jgi:hypothetical protein
MALAAAAAATSTSAPSAVDMVAKKSSAEASLLGRLRKSHLITDSRPRHAPPFPYRFQAHFFCRFVPEEV